MNRPRGPELTVVIPAYNEGAGLADTLSGWSTELGRLGIVHVLRVYDDGSTDDTPNLLLSAGDRVPNLEVVAHENRGHGPTVLRGYHEAGSEWILQLDGDDEVGPAPFAALWNRRADYDLLVGVRYGRNTSPVRRLVTRCAKAVVRTMFGAVLEDVNAPYRLMRRKAFAPLFDELAADSFAPNVALGGVAAFAGLRILQTPVRCHRRTGSDSSLRWFQLVRGVAKSFGQTAVLAWRVRRQVRRTRTSRGPA